MRLRTVLVFGSWLRLALVAALRRKSARLDNLLEDVIVLLGLFELAG